MRLTERVFAVLDRRLSPDASAPLAVALSGGGDSTALLLLVHGWAQARGRRLQVLTVDHRLQRQGGAWGEACADLCARLGLPHRTLAWTGEKPARGLPAAARAARHALLAEAARGVGAKVVLLGHTADDLAEAAAMRAAGSTTPDPREWAPSPAWPEGRGLFLLRPLLAERRAELRAFLSDRGMAWIEDPANLDPRFARARARAALAGSAGAAPRPPCAERRLSDLATADDFGAVRLDRPGLLAHPEGRRALAAALACAGGAVGPARGDRLGRLWSRLADGLDFEAGLAGARLVAHGRTLMVVREAGEFARRPVPPLDLPPGRARVWDGRFEFCADGPRWRVAPLAGRAASLSPAARRALGALPAQARRGLPALLRDGEVLCPALEPVDAVMLRCLVPDRLAAALGGVRREPA